MSMIAGVSQVQARLGVDLVHIQKVLITHANTRIDVTWGYSTHMVFPNVNVEVALLG